MCIGMPPSGSAILGADHCEFVFKNLTINGCLVGTRSDTAAALDFAKRGMLQQVSEVYSINRSPEGVEKLRKGQVAGRIVVKFNWEE